MLSLKTPAMGDLHVLQTLLTIVRVDGDFVCRFNVAFVPSGCQITGLGTVVNFLSGTCRLKPVAIMNWSTVQLEYLLQGETDLALPMHVVLNITRKGLLHD